MELDLSGKIVLVTGATGGIGEAIIEVFAERGASLAIHYGGQKDKAEELVQRAGNGSAAFQAELSDEKATVDLFQRVLAYFGKLDTLVNNAGVFIASPIDDAEQWLKDWHRTLSINLTATGLLCREAVRHFKEEGDGRIINIASRAAWRGDTGDHLDYAASKGGMVALTKSIARAWGAQGIKAFCVAPGFVRTPMAEAVIGEKGEKALLDELALPQLTEPMDIAPTVLYLASGTMDHATGQTIDINAASYVR